MIAFNLHLVAHTLALKLPQAGVRGMNERLHIGEQMGNVNSTPHANVCPEMEKSPNNMAPAQNYLKSVAEHFSNDLLMGGDGGDQKREEQTLRFKIARMEARVPESKCIHIACQRINRNYFNFNFNAWEWCVLLCSCVGGRKAYRLGRQCIGSKQNKSNRQRCPLGSGHRTLHRT